MTILLVRLRFCHEGVVTKFCPEGVGTILLSRGGCDKILSRGGWDNTFVTRGLRRFLGVLLCCSHVPKKPEVFATEFVGRMRVIRKYGKKVITEALNKQGYIGEDDGVLVKKFKAYVSGIHENAKQDKDEDELAERLKAMSAK